MVNLQVGQLVLDSDGYYAIVMDVPALIPPLRPTNLTRSPAPNHVLLFLSNGLRVEVPATSVTPLGLKPDLDSDPPASFLEVLSGRYQ